MGRNSRDDGLNFKAVWVNGKPIRKSLIHKSWTYIAKECYKRGCNCFECNLIPQLESLYKCRIKDYVMAYIKMGFDPEDDEEIEDEE